MNKRYHVMALIIEVMLVLTACSSGGQVMDGEDMVRSYTQISQEEARQLMEQDGTQIIVDVRTQEEYEKKHVLGAICVPIEDIRADKLDKLPDKNKTLMLYCWTGRRSEDASALLVKQGYKKVYDFGGLVDWTGEVEGAEVGKK